MVGIIKSKQQKFSQSDPVQIRSHLWYAMEIILLKIVLM